MSKIEKVLVTGKTHTTQVKAGDHNSKVNLKLNGTGAKEITFDAVAAHPTAEQLFAGAWSSCYSLALGLAAEQNNVKLPADTSVDIEVDLGQTGEAYFLGARLTVNLPGLSEEVATTVAHAADQICPYSKAVRGNIDVAIKVTTA
ncbi:Ohr family peroxiredoxin [Pseudoduganella sp. RAF53_2]|uniref:Ohr family peroxiredoxin n=1 Tax=unclassified Pseudoduganella TaxID=2637179 RepID=UPI003F991B20